jgi:hypothetical protein
VIKGDMSLLKLKHISDQPLKTSGSNPRLPCWGAVRERDDLKGNAINIEKQTVYGREKACQRQ